MRCLLLGFVLAIGGCSLQESSGGTGFGGSGDGSGGVGGASSSGTSTATSTSTGSASGASGTGGGSCDTLSCGDFGSGCIGCAVKGACEGPYASCVNSKPCYDYSQCAGTCDDDASACVMKCGADPDCESGCESARQACTKACASQNQDGATKFTELVTCVVCHACANACSKYAAGCP
jgi:hypothetical protein